MHPAGFYSPPTPNLLIYTKQSVWKVQSIAVPTHDEEPELNEAK